MKRTLILILSFLLCFATLSSAANKLSDPKELEAFMDGLMAAHLKTYNIPGASLCVVKGDKIIFTKGYGFADIEKGIKVDPNKTLFRPGSCSKLFTWTAVMQLAENKKLDLYRDVNTYLKDSKIPDTFIKPITLADLLTHTPGFEDSSLGMLKRSYKELLPLKDYIRDHMPRRIWEPGIKSAYSNYGCALAGYVVECVTSLPFNTYVVSHIFSPLEMKNTTFDQEQTAKLKKYMSRGYHFKDGKYIAGDFEFINPFPAGSAVTTACDMGRFMIAHLNDGKYKNTRILNASTLREMQRRHWSYDPRINGMCYGFAELSTNNQRVIGHTGATDQFRSILFLIPEDKVGVFASYNSPGGSSAVNELLEAFLDHYYPVPIPKISAKAGLLEKYAVFNGFYRSNRRPFTTFEKVLQLFTPTTSLQAQPEGTLLLRELGRPKQLIELGEELFRELYGRNKSVLRRIDGRTYLVTLPVSAYEKQLWHETNLFNWLLYLACNLIFLTAVIAWPLIPLINFRKGRKNPFGAGISRLVSLSACLIFLVSFPLIYINLENAFYDINSLAPYLWIPLIGLLLTLVTLFFTLVVWKKGYWSIWGRLHYGLVTLALLAFIWWLNCYNLLGFKF